MRRNNNFRRKDNDLKGLTVEVRNGDFNGAMRKFKRKYKKQVLFKKFVKDNIMSNQANKEKEQKPLAELVG